MARRGMNPEATRANIRATTAELFKSNGVHATSLGDIAQAVNLSKGTLYYHYPAKDELVLEIAEEHFSDMSADIFAWIDSLNQDVQAGPSILWLTNALLNDRERLRLHLALVLDALREESVLCEWLRIKQKEWRMLLDLGAIKMSGPAAKKFRSYSDVYFSLLDGFAMHLLLSGEADTSLINELLALDDAE
ncbi:TetR/AcrR family transcriptional regulator [Christensenellaceae bacterium OttesenSCG-928-L17]|nr:TetR/AcrR family transcriptional regulator [Christensenellaceae bacterium OttesenSCG-928-L17]